MFAYAISNFRAPLTRVRVVKLVEHCASDFGLCRSMLETKPTRVHWHWKRGGVSGTLEVTWDVKGNQIVVSVHDNRVGAGEWARRDVPKFAARLAETLKGETWNL